MVVWVEYSFIDSSRPLLRVCRNKVQPRVMLKKARNSNGGTNRTIRLTQHETSLYSRHCLRAPGLPATQAGGLPDSSRRSSAATPPARRSEISNRPRRGRRPLASLQLADTPYLRRQRPANVGTEKARAHGKIFRVATFRPPLSNKVQMCDPYM